MIQLYCMSKAVSPRSLKLYKTYVLIPNAYKVLMAYMNTNGLKGKWDGHLIDCFEKEYELDGVWHMDVYIAVE